MFKNVLHFVPFKLLDSDAKGQSSLQRYYEGIKKIEASLIKSFHNQVIKEYIAALGKNYGHMVTNSVKLGRMSESDQDIAREMINDFNLITPFFKSEAVNWLNDSRWNENKIKALTKSFFYKEAVTPQDKEERRKAEEKERTREEANKQVKKSEELVAKEEELNETKKRNDEELKSGREKLDEEFKGEKQRLSDWERDVSGREQGLQSREDDVKRREAKFAKDMEREDSTLR